MQHEPVDTLQPIRGAARIRPARRLYVPALCRFAAILVGVAVLALPLAARAISDEEKYESAIMMAVVEFGSGHWQEARVMFERAHALQPSARTWRGLGVTSFEMRRYVRAIYELEMALADTRKPLTDELRRNAEQTLRLARGYIATYELRVEPDDAEVLIDGTPVDVPRDGKLMLDPGSHTIELKGPDQKSVRRSIMADAGTQAQLKMSLRMVDTQSRAVPTSPAEDAASSPVPRHGRGYFLAGWITAATAVALAGVSVGYGIATQRSQEDFDACSSGCDSIRAKGQRQQRVTNATAAVAGAAALGAVVAFSLGAKRGRERRQTVAVSPTGLRYGLAF